MQKFIRTKELKIYGKYKTAKKTFRFLGKKAKACRMIRQFRIPYRKSKFFKPYNLGSYSTTKE